MYFPYGWPKLLDTSLMSSSLVKICLDRVKVLIAILSEDELSIWYTRPCVPITLMKRNGSCVKIHGKNKLVEWKPDSTMILVATEKTGLLIYSVEISNKSNGIYNQNDSPSSNLQRESAELFIKESIPPLFLKLTTIVQLSVAITCVVCITGAQLMVGTNTNKIMRLCWEDGKEDKDYTLDLKRMLFGINQHVNCAVPIKRDDICVVNMDYSPLLGGFAIILSDGRAAFLTATNLKFDPSQVNGIWAQNLDNATVTAINHKYRLIGFGRKNSQVDVYTIDELTGGLELSHMFVLSAKDFPGSPGEVKELIWTPDGCAAVLSWSNGGISLWSTYGAMLMCSLGWDYGLHVDLLTKNPLNIISMEWSTEGYQLLCIQKAKKKENYELVQKLNNGRPEIFAINFLKCALALNPSSNSNSYILLQGDDKLYINHGESLQKVYSDGNLAPKFSGNIKAIEISSILAENKNWIVISLPSSYYSTNWPIRLSALDDNMQNIAVAGRTGLAIYSLAIKKWKLFGNESQEKDFVITGGLLWWKEFAIMGSYNLMELNDEIRIYNKDNKLDNRFAKTIKMASPVMLLNVFKHQLIVFTANGCINFFKMDVTETKNIIISFLHNINIKNICVHPACVVSISITNLKNESSFRINQGHSSEKIVLNVSGRVLMVQKQNNRETNMQLNSVCLASSVECIWISHSTKSHLRDSLWFFCGCYGMRVWLPVFPRESHGSRSHRHTFMSKRIMLSFILRIYPIAILFEDAIILGAENDTLLYSNNPELHFSLPFCTIERTGQVYLNQILRQLIRRNLGYNAWEIARSCSKLPYFPHALELLLHEVLEEEATSKEPIPDALLPSILDFIQEFPVYLQTVVQCARKTEIALWPYLFSAAGKPKDLFQHCLSSNQLETAASYLIILQNLESSSISRHYATLLLDLALQQKKWCLGRDLARFLRAIDPSDAESPRNSFLVSSKLHIHSIQHPSDDELNLILGTLSGRCRSLPSTILIKAEESLVVKRDTFIDAMGRKKSVPVKERSGTTAEEEFFIENILQKHAKTMLKRKKLDDLGQMAALLDFQLVQWLSKERKNSAKVENFVDALKQLHDELSWPKPFWIMSTMKNNYSTSQNEIYSHATPDSKQTIDDSGCKSYGDKLKSSASTNIEKSSTGYLSILYDPVLSDHALKKINFKQYEISPELNNAYLPQRIDKLSNDGLLLSVPESKLTTAFFKHSCTSFEDCHWNEEPINYEINETCYNEFKSDMNSFNSTKLSIKLRYLLQIFIEAECLDMALLISILLLDVAAVERIVNSAIRANSLLICSQLKNGLKDLTQWSFTECLGYKSFMLSLQNQIKKLHSFELTHDEKNNIIDSYKLRNFDTKVAMNLLTYSDSKTTGKNIDEIQSSSKLGTNHEISVSSTVVPLNEPQNPCILM